jgi:putative exosortase-associated protein (TIGR04073 family)
MIKTLSLLGAAMAVGLLATGCAGPDKKLTRGFSNVSEVVRFGELRRAREQAGVWYHPHDAHGIGLMSGINRTFVRIGVGLYEMATFPLPPYDPVLTDYISPRPVYPECSMPGLPDDVLFQTDSGLGFSGGVIAPIIPGSRFAVFRNP